VSDLPPRGADILTLAATGLASVSFSASRSHSTCGRPGAHQRCRHARDVRLQPSPRRVARRRAPALPASALRADGRRLAGMASSPGTLAHHFSCLQRDLQDPDLHASVRRQAKETRRQLRRLLVEAVAAGELRHDTDTRSLARTVEVVINGALLTWGLLAEGTAAALVRRELTAVLRQALPPAAARRS
jgi:hypothetical protein